MHNELILIHRQDSHKFSQEEINQGKWLSWQTCLRRILIGHADFTFAPDLQEGDQIIRGQKAYEFLVQVVSGLHSPMLGETEVFGQFKKLVDELVIEEFPWGHFLEKTLLSIVADVKEVRRNCLIGLGSNSYGSLARRKVKNAKEIHFIGSGIFVKDLLPWFLKMSADIVIHCRNPEKAEKLMLEIPGDTTRVKIKSLFTMPADNMSGVIIVAAPVKANDIHKWLRPSDIHKVLDLRGESSEDPINLPCHISPLQNFFNELETQKQFCQERVSQAKKRISDLAYAKFYGTQFRPFGWEDLCC